MRFEALGPVRVRVDDATVSLRPAQRRLLAAFLLTPHVPIPIDTLIDRLWVDSPPATARRAIHVHLSALRRRIPTAIRSGPGGYVLELDGHGFDVPEFSALAEGSGRLLREGRFRDAGDLAARAVRLWRGDPYPELAELELARGERDHLIELLVGTRTTQARALTLQGRVSEAIALLRQLVVEQPLNETIWEELVLAFYMAGRAADARATLQLARETLHHELAVEPGPRLVELEGRVLRHDPTLLGPPVVERSHNLPSEESSFVGRTDDLVAVADLTGAHRLTTITGPPGIGKTRLAVEVAKRQLDEHPAGAWLVRLDGARTEMEVLAAIASVMGVRDLVDDLDQLHRVLADRSALVILDGCDHVLGAVRSLLRTRLHGDQLRVLATGRTRLDLDDERVWPLRPLSVPEDIDGMWDATTVQLMVDRVAAADPGVDLTTADPADLIEVCRRTGGMPLAIELAARRIRSLDLRRVAGRTFADDRRSVGPVPSHETSVADAIGRSVDLLATEDRDPFYAAAVFAAPFTAPAFGSVCMREVDGPGPDDALGRLVEASLLIPERTSDGTVRYRMLEPVRDFGLRRLAGTQRSRAARDRHADWFVLAARRTAEATWTAAESGALDMVEASIADFRMAMRHLLDSGRPRLASEIAAGLSQFWVSRFLAREGQGWLAECLDSDVDDESRLDMLAAASGVAFFVGHYDESAALSQQVLDIAVRQGDRRHEARALYGIGRVRIHRVPAEGEAQIYQAVAIYEDLGDRVAAAECRVAIGIQAAYAGDRPKAEAILAGPTALLEQADYPRIASVGHRHLSLAAWHDGDEPSARSHLDRAMALAVQANDRRVLSGVLSQLGLIEATWGDPADAAATLIKALKLTSGQHGIYFSLTAFGALALLVAREEWAMAARLLAHFDQIHRDHGWIPLDQRNAAVPGYRARILDGLAEDGERPDLAQVPTRIMADALMTRLAVIAAS